MTYDAFLCTRWCCQSLQSVFEQNEQFNGILYASFSFPGKIQDQYRVDQTLSTIYNLVERGGRPILM